LNGIPKKALRIKQSTKLISNPQKPSGMIPNGLRLLLPIRWKTALVGGLYPSKGSHPSHLGEEIPKTGEKAL